MASKKELSLIIDKDNLLGSVLAQNLSLNATVVLITKDRVVGEGDIIVVPYVAPFPQIPDGLYANILWVWSEKDADLAGSLAQKAQEQNARFLIIATKDKRESVMEHNPQGTVLVLGDVFDASDKFALGKFLQKTKATKKIALSNMGLHVWHPVSLADVVKGIAGLVVQKKEFEKEYFIGPKHEYTALSIAHGLQKANPELVIDFVQSNEPEGDKFHVHQSIFESYDAIKALRDVYARTFAKKIKEASVSVVFGAHAKRSNRSWWGGYVFYLIFLSVILPVVFVAASTFLGYFLLVGSFDDLKSGNAMASLQKTKAADINFSIAQDTLVVAGMEAKLVGQERVIALVERQIANGRTTTKLMEHGAEAIGAFSRLFTGKTTSAAGDVETAVSAVKQEVLLLQNLDMTSIPQQYRGDINNLQQIGNTISGVIDEAPSILGVGKDVSYLVLFQNNMELRPGGGFIGSYGILKLHNGAVKEFSIHDVYDADGQLKGHVEPPFAIRRYIPIVHLYLRDSNFDPDFTVNAKKAAQLLAQETGDRVDGVVGVDLSALKTVLAATGGVYVPSYGETVTQDNFFTLIEKHVEKNFFPGSTQKKDFLRAFAQALLEKLQKGASLNISSLLQGLNNLFLGKDVVVAFSNPSLQAPFALANLSGALPSLPANSQGTLNDFAGVVEANLGVNKVNAFISRKLSQRVAVDEKGNVVEKLAITLTNDSDGTWPGGAYKNYLRFILPLAAVVQGITVDNIEQHMVAAVTDPKAYEAKTFIAPRGLEVEKESTPSLAMYGFLVTIPEKSSREIEISYTIPHAFSDADKKRIYRLHIWKQIGIDSFPYTFSFTIPQSMQFLSIPQGGKQDGETVTYEEDINTDKDSTFSFASQ